MKKVQFLRETERGTDEYGASPFADLTEDEFRKQKLGLKPKPVSELPPADIPDVHLPPDYDWRHYNAVTPVKNQGTTFTKTYTRYYAMIIRTTSYNNQCFVKPVDLSSTNNDTYYISIIKYYIADGYWIQCDQIWRFIGLWATF